MIAQWPVWMYRGEESRLFYEGQEIPNDWYDAPSKFNGADPKAFDHDKDGRAGGSFSIEGSWPAEPPAQPKRRGRPPKVRSDAV